MVKNLLIILLMTVAASAFSFDVWKSGLNLEDAVLVAKENNIPLVKASYAFQIKKGFDWKYLDDYKKYRNFRYFTTLMGHDATIYLYFTQNSKKLYKVKILWNFVYESRSDFEKKLIEILNREYGQFSVKESKNIGEALLKERFKIWVIDSDNYLVEEKALAVSMSLYYVDKKLLDKDLEFKRNKKNSVIKLDTNKF